MNMKRACAWYKNVTPWLYERMESSAKIFGQETLNIVSTNDVTEMEQNPKFTTELGSSKPIYVFRLSDWKFTYLMFMK